MITHIIEVNGQDFNWGKFLLGRFDKQEWTRPSELPGNDLTTPLIAQRGWSPHHILVLDLETGEGFITQTWGSPQADLAKHNVWVCPMFEPFLTWLYKQDVQDITRLPKYVYLQDFDTAMSGFRRAGPTDKNITPPQHRVLLTLSQFPGLSLEKLATSLYGNWDLAYTTTVALVEELQRRDYLTANLTLRTKGNNALS